MKRIIGLTTAALMGASVFVAPAFAQNADGVDQDYQLSVQPEGSDPGAPTTNRATTPDIDTGTTAAIGGSFDGALSAIGRSSANARTIASMDNVQSVNVVRMSELRRGDAALVDQTVGKNQKGIDALRAALDANPALHRKLQAMDVTSASVVGADVGAAGNVTVYVM